MQKQTGRTVQGAGLDRRLSFSAVRVHNDHLQSGRRTGSACPICENGLGGALETIEETRAPDSSDEVATDSGTDEEEDAPPSPRTWDDPR